MRPSLVLSANALAGVGGQGLNLRHMIDALEEDFELIVYSQGSAPGGRRAVPPSRLANVLGRVPLVRRRKDWITLASDVHFDAQVAARMPRASFFQGVVGQCALSLFRARRRGAATVLDVVNTHVDDFAGHVERESAKFGVPSFIGPGMKRRIRAEYRRADLIRVMSERARRTFLERGVPEAKVFVATPPVEPIELPGSLRDRSRFRVGFIGLLEPWKGFHYLLDAFEGFPVRDAELVLWGGSGSRPASRMLARLQAVDPRVLVRPVPIRQAGFPEVFGKMSVLVHPSLADGFAYAVAEAMSAGVPVIVTENTGAADLVEEGVSGYIVPVGHSGAIRERLEHLAANPDLVERMGQCARRAALRLTPAAFRASLVPAIKALR